MRDPYEMLGVSKGATEAEIKSAYRRLAKKLHPDANKHDQRAASRFAELNAAYEILGEESKRKAYDRGKDACTRKYAKQEGTMYRSFEAMCASELAASYARKFK